MSCQYRSETIHDYLDQRLSASEAAAFEEHVGLCLECRTLYEELVWLREALASREHIPQAAARRLWARLERRRRWGVGHFIVNAFNPFRSYWRDLDRNLLWARFAAVPISLGFFVLILVQFPLDIPDLTYPVFAFHGFSLTAADPHLMDKVQVRQANAEINGLMDTAWKIPYEDSLSLVVEITPEGYAQIGDVLEYPKSPDLLEAVDLSLRHSQFEAAHDHERPFMIYSFQKIDVYESRRGL